MRTCSIFFWPLNDGLPSIEGNLGLPHPAIDHIGLSRPLSLASLALNDSGSEFRIAHNESPSKLPSDNEKNGGLERRLGVQSEHQRRPHAVLHRLCLPLIRCGS